MSPDIKAPTLGGFIGRLFLFVASGGLLGSLVILAFYRLTLQATRADQKIITGRGWPITLFGALIYFFTIIVICRPLFRFVRAIGQGRKFDDEFLFHVQDQALNLGPKMAMLAVFFYFGITPLNLALSVRFLGWPWSTLWYAVFAGGISTFLLIPLAMNLASWTVRPIIEYSVQMLSGASTSRRGGYGINLRSKLFVTFLPIICAALLFASIIGYSQTQTILDNYFKMQQSFVGPEKQQLLLDRIEHKGDPGIRSARYFQDRMGNLKLFYLLFILVALAISLILAIISASEMTQPVKILANVAKKIEDGNIEESVRIVTNDELSQLGASVNRMMRTIIAQMNAMKEVVESLRDGIIQLDNTARTLLEVSAGQSTGATEQASAVQEASSVAEEIFSTAKQIAERANEVDVIAASTLQACTDGGIRLEDAQSGFVSIAEQADSMLSSMEDLDGRFRETYAIVKWTEEIAEQTEMLSLNAALEAVGAGAEGHRFAVVAEATRRLALRAVKGARNIKNMVENIQNATLESIKSATSGKEKVAAGGQAVDKAMDALKNISSLASTTSSIVHEITLSTRQQSLASEQLTASFREVNEVAKMVEDSAKKIESAINRLQGFAESLRHNVEKETPQS